MQTKAKANSTVTSKTSEDGSAIIFGAVGAGTVTLTLSKLSEAVRNRAMVHGLIQRVSDRAAKGRDATTGLPATPEVKLAAMAALVAHYESGTDDWSPAVASGPRPLDMTIIRAVMEAIGKDEDFVRAYIAKKAEDGKVTPAAYLAHLATGKTVAPIVDRMRAASLTSDAEDDLAEMMGEEAGDQE